MMLSYLVPVVLVLLLLAASIRIMPPVGQPHSLCAKQMCRVPWADSGQSLVVQRRRFPRRENLLHDNTPRAPPAGAIRCLQAAEPGQE